MRFTVIFPLVFILSALWPWAAHSETESLFKSGIAAFQKNDFKQAHSQFVGALQQEPSNTLLLFNLGLTELHENQIGSAIGLLRKALAIEPDLRSARSALRFATKKLEHSEIPHEVDLFDSLHESAFAPISLEKYIFITGILLLAAGWLMLRYFGARRRALLDESRLPAFPTIGIFASLLFFCALFLLFGKINDTRDLRGTIIVKMIEARSTPDANGTPLFELYEGLEVIVRSEARREWAQVTYPGGATGWIPRNSIFTTQDQVQP